MSEEIVDAILSARLDIDPADPNWEHESWPLVQGIVSLEEMRMLAPFLCAGGDVYRAQVVGYYQDGEASARAEVIVDVRRLVVSALHGYVDLLVGGRVILIVVHLTPSPSAHQIEPKQVTTKAKLITGLQHDLTSSAQGRTVGGP
jgi:hypothetical protein